MALITTLRAVPHDREARRAVVALAMTMANAWAPPGVMDAVAPLWTSACVLLRQLRTAAA